MATALNLGNANGKTITLRNPDTNNSDISVEMDKVVVKDVNGNISQSGTTASQFSMNVGGNLKGWLYAGTSGTALASSDYLTFNINNTEKVRIDSAGKVGIGVTPSYTLHVVNGSGNCTMYGQYGSGTYGGWTIVSDGIYGVVNGAASLKIDTSNNILQTAVAGLGYGTGAGGTVTQLTSKSTAVTLNKPSGRITMNNAALAAGESVTFIVSNSLVGTNDTSIATAKNGNYEARSVVTVAGSLYIKLTNVSGSTLSDFVDINFSIIKGSNS